MAQQVHCTVEIAGDNLPGIESVSINQDINDHHSFEVLCRFDDIEKATDSLLDSSRKLVGSIAVIKFTSGLNQGKNKSLFKGIVTEVGFDRTGRGNGLVSFTGHGLTIQLEGHRAFRGYTDMKLTEIAQEMCGTVNSVTFDGGTPRISHSFQYLLQYNETDFAFLRRIARPYGEWVYYNGQKLQLGKGVGNKIDLRIGHHLDSFRLSSSVSPIQQRVAMRNYLDDDKLEVVKPKDSPAQKLNPLSKQLEDHSKQMFKSTHHMAGFSAEGSNNSFRDSWDTMADSAARSVASTLTVASGRSDQPEITVGSVLSITSKSDGREFDYGTYFVTRVNHYYNGNDRYTNSFEAIPDSHDVFPLNFRISEPYAGPVPAIVADNNDPKKLGRVRVKFIWDDKAVTPWLRCVTTYAGRDRGFYFVPEKNEEVLVDFESGNPNYPFVVGSLYNGKNNFNEHFDGDNNSKKAIRTIGGNEILFDDTQGKESITITNTTKKEKNIIKITVDDKGKILLSTQGDIELKANANIKFDAGKDLEIKVSGKMSIDVKQDLKIASNKTNMSSQSDTEVNGTAGLKLKSNGTTSIEGVQVEAKAQAKASLGGAMTEVKGSGPVTIQGAIVKIN